MRGDLQVAIRQMRRTPLTAFLACATLGIGLAATLAIGSVVRGVVFRDLPYPDADRLVLVWQESHADPGDRAPLSPPDVVDLREASREFAALAAINSFSTSFLPEEGDPEQIQLGVVMGDFFDVLRVPALYGRLLEAADDRPLDTRDSTVIAPLVLDHAFWVRRFAADPGVIGSTIRMGGSRMRVVGVLPASFRLHMPAGGGMSTDLAGWTPLGIDAAAAPRDGAYLKVIGRLTDGSSVGRAQADVDRTAIALRERIAFHEEAGTRFRVEPLHREVTAHIRPVLLVLAFMGSLVLLVACGNAAALLLVRFLDRRSELAIRGALGAARRRLVRQLLTESGIITTAGMLVGVLLAHPVLRVLLRLEPGIVPRTSAIGIDATMLGAAALLALVTALVCGLGPALVVARGPLSVLLRSHRSGPSAGVRRLRSALVVAQAAAAFALLYGSVFLAGTLVRLDRDDHGFRAESALTFRVTLPFARYRGPDAWVPFFDELEARLGAIPGVVSVGATADLPLAGGLSPEPISDATAQSTTDPAQERALHHVVTPGYFASAGIAVREGRAFTAADRDGSRAVAIVDQALADRLARRAPGPILGRTLEVTVHQFRAGYSITQRRVEVVGVVATVPHDHPDAAAPGSVHLPLAQYPLWSMGVVVHGATNASTIRAAVGSLDPELPVQSLRPLRALIDDVLEPTRFVLALIAIFAAVVIGLTASALFGIVAEAVRQRRRELGVRLALGATPRSLIVRMLLGGVALAALGAVPGALLAPTTGRLLERALATSAGTDLATIAGAALGLLTIAALACAVPAWRAGRIDPLTTLREE